MATWPDLTDYHEALQYPERSLRDSELQKAQIEKDRFGMPKPATGGNAVAYKATEGQNVWAVRCFLRPISDHAERYAAISKHLQKNRADHCTKFFYLADGLRIKGGTFPIVKMAWVQGPNLDRFVEGVLDKPRELAALREKFRALVKDIEVGKFAHGDLQHENIPVSGKELPRLEAVLTRSAGLKPLQLKADAPRAPEKPRWCDKPSKSGTAADLASQWKVVWTRPGEKTETRWKKEMKDGPVVVESEVEVVAPNPVPVATIALGALAAGVLIGTSVSPELGMVAAGGGLVFTRGITKSRKKRAFHTVIRPVEQQVLEQAKVAVPGHKS